ncbi:MAG: LacI family transcriptional regulator [Spirochaetaceae bacterium]|jgi:LacI family transcriptional regulator|nr:LacI family transcriptional regulator [Spirochaetaceae bacterium]
MATIREIARIAGVSTATVSNVIHGNTGKVSAEKLAEIQILLDQFRYVKKLGLSHLNNARSRIICLAINSSKTYENSIFADPFYGQILGVAEGLLQEKAYYLMLYVSASIEDIFRTVAAWNIDGIIAVTFRAEDCDKLQRLTEKPLVSIDIIGEVSRRFVNIGLEDFEGAYRMTQHLITRGYQDILILANSDFGVDHERWRGYRKALDEGGLPYDGSRYVLISTEMERRLSQYETLIPRLKKGTALFFMSDFYALEAIGFLAKNNIAVPDDVGVAGFDDTVYSRLSVPPLTTVRQDISRKASVAVEQLLILLRGGLPERRDIRLPVELMVREST